MKVNKSTILGFLGLIATSAVSSLIMQKQQSAEIRDIIDEYERQKAEEQVESEEE